GLHERLKTLIPDEPLAVPATLVGWAQEVEREIVASAEGVVCHVTEKVVTWSRTLVTPGGHPPGRLLQAALDCSQHADCPPESRLRAVAPRINAGEGIASLVETYRHGFAGLRGLLDAVDHELRHLWILLRLGTAVVIGMIRDGVVVHGFDAIDGYELTEWLQ